MRAILNFTFLIVLFPSSLREYIFGAIGTARQLKPIEITGKAQKYPKRIILPQVY